MKTKISTICLVLITLAVSLFTSLPALAGIAWISNAIGKVDIQQEIVDNHNGSWTYNYTIVNVAEDPVWWVVIYHNEIDQTAKRPIKDAAHPDWLVYGGLPTDFEMGAPEEQNSYIYSWTGGYERPYNVPYAISAGQTVGGLSFTSDIYDPSAKRFVYDVKDKWVNQGYTATGDQIFTAGGITIESTVVPEPGTFCTVGLPVLMIGLGRLRNRCKRA